MRKAARLLGTLLLVAGLLTVAWVITVWQWQDPFTAIYTHFEQEHLSHEYTRRAAAFRARTSKDVADLHSFATEAAAYGRTLKEGDPVGRIVIGRIGLSMIVVQGTDEASLRKGPGHYVASGLPGEGKLIYIAGHRTTYLAPFSQINAIRIGDYIRLEMPYGNFTYRVVRHYVVVSTDLKVLRNVGYELLRLQACHPRFFATHRYIVDAKLVAATPVRAAGT
jgi:sortase A